MNDMIISLEKVNAVDLFHGGDLDDLLRRIESEARSVAPDISTAKGRKSIASVAAKVARCKTHLDGLGKDLVSDLKAKTAAVDKDRRRMREFLDELKADIRQPLTDWEAAEDARIEGIKGEISILNDLPEPLEFETHSDRIEYLEEKIKFVELIAIDDSWQEFIATAAQAKDAALYRLRQALEKTLAKEKQEAEEEAKREQEERERIEAARKAQQAREERIAREAAERAKAKAKAAAERKQREHELEQMRERQARLDAEQRAREAEEQRWREAEQAERDRIAAIKRAQQEAIAEARRKEQEQEATRKAEEEARAKRAADKARRAEINEFIADAFEMYAGIMPDDADALVDAIAAGKIPRVSIDYESE